MTDLELLATPLTGGPVRAMARDQGAIAGPHGVIGVDVAERAIDGQTFTAVQLLLDDDHPLFDRALLDGPVVAVATAADGTVLAREPFDHDAFRRRLLAERTAGESTTRGVLVRTGGELPPPYVRLAFLPIALAATAGGRLVVHQTTVADLLAGIEAAHADGQVTDRERQALLASVEQRHPDPSP